MRSKNSCKGSKKIFRALLASTLLTVPVQFASAQLNIALSNSKLGTVIQQIQSQSKYQFFYDDDLASMPIPSINVQNSSVEEVLNQVLAGKGVTYKVDENVIYLSKNVSSTRSISTSSQQEAEKTITGTIVDASGMPLIGVTVMEKGTTNGSITDFDGKYSLKVSANAIVQFSYVGYKSVEMSVSGKTTIDLTMKEDTEVLEEVVVTALGIKRAEKALSYNVQQVNADDITTNKDVNFVNSLSGKVAGVNINASSSGVGGVSKGKLPKLAY